VALLGLPLARRLTTPAPIAAGAEPAAASAG